jgi:hypothetical protein
LPRDALTAATATASRPSRLLSTLSGGHVIITSRLANFGGHFDPLELDVLGLEDAAAFLLGRTDAAKLGLTFARYRQLWRRTGRGSLAGSEYEISTRRCGYTMGINGWFTVQSR